MHDIVFPQGNEEEFIKIAEKLGIKSLTFVYSDAKQFYAKKAEIKYDCAALCQPPKIPSLKSKKIPFLCPASRDAIERGAPLVFAFETTEDKDHTHYRRSGLNQVLCKLATQKKTSIGFSLHTLLSVEGRKRATIMGRIMQNIIFLRKYKTNVKIASFATNPYEMRAPSEITSLFVSLGMRPEEAKKALVLNPFK
jgi:hypothetical protein